MNLGDYRQRRQRALYRIMRMRQLDAPVLLVRNEQMLMWGLRQLYHNQRPSPISALPQYRSNYRKFIKIHMHDRSVH